MGTRTNEKTYTYEFGKVDYKGVGYKNNAVEVKVSLYENGKGLPVFSAAASVWNKFHTDIVSGGQILDQINKHCREIASNEEFQAILDMWEKHHLNDMHAGTSRQEAAIDEGFKTGEIDPSTAGWNYDYMCDYLQSLDLLYDKEYLVKGVDGEDTPYKYGSSWLYKEIPPDDFELINAMVEGHLKEYLNERQERADEEIER